MLLRVGNDRHRCVGRSLTVAVAAAIIALAAGCGSSSSSDEPSIPNITGVSPNQAAVIGGTRVVITTTGYDVSFLTALPTVEFGGVPGMAVTGRTPGSVTVTVPAGGPGTVNVTVTSFDGQQSATLIGGLTYTTAPIVVSVSPIAGDIAGGETVTITGDNFATAGTVTVTFGTVDATGVNVADRTTITCLTPAHPSGTVTVWVTNPSTEMGFLTDAYTFSGIDPLVVAMEDQVFILVNQERALVGKPALVHDPAIRVVARLHSEDMRDRGFFDHVNPDGDLPWDRLDAAGIPWWAVAENIAWNQGAADPAQYAVDGWLNSPAHKRNMLDEGNEGYTLTGVGCARNISGRWWFTQVFVRP